MIQILNRYILIILLLVSLSLSAVADELRTIPRLPTIQSLGEKNLSFAIQLYTEELMKPYQDKMSAMQQTIENQAKEIEKWKEYSKLLWDNK
jgi:hypothetical protein